MKPSHTPFEQYLTVDLRPHDHRIRFPEEPGSAAAEFRQNAAPAGHGSPGRVGTVRSATTPKWSLAQTPPTGWSKTSSQPATWRVGP
jgi:hypothetical protein